MLDLSSRQIYDVLKDAHDTTYGYLGWVKLLGIDFHAEFIAVKDTTIEYEGRCPVFQVGDNGSEDGYLRSDAADMYERIEEALMPSGGFETIEFKGQQYVVILYPFSRA